MGRGRAKAKQTKVARKLKYAGAHTDLDQLRRELGVDDEPRDGGAEAWEADPYADLYSEYAEYSQAEETETGGRHRGPGA